MCYICMQETCPSGCPNAPEPIPAMRCARCGVALYGGDRHYEGICERCLGEMGAPEWLGLFGEKMEEV